MSTHYSQFHIGKLNELDQHTFRHDGLPFDIKGKRFLHGVLGLTGCEISFNKLPPGGGMPFYHTHRENEEVYLFIGGEGEFQVDGEVFKVTEGSVVRVAPQAERCWRNRSGGDLIYIDIQCKAGSFEGGGTIEDGVAVDKDVQWGEQP